ncbi:hypothetical protein JTE90_002838 [Oedothorax gibbosus]|uniref:Uncharacterized protein n=1 Tax=Oedothorax gibbosus TaxID=931172 RepID=A0AAV6UH46_9ARAC|nr:hypothetical protein JTE90_002838 [Oedothorax gibbosus]
MDAHSKGVGYTNEDSCKRGAGEYPIRSSLQLMPQNPSAHFKTHPGKFPMQVNIGFQRIHTFGIRKIFYS